MRKTHNEPMKDNTHKYDKNKIDLVYLWVDGNDIKHKELRKVWQEKLGVPVSESNNDHKYVEHEELRYSLRTAMINAPWIRKIFIVTNGQVPKWLDMSKTNNIEIITHDQIMPKDALPTFNSQAIELCIDKIPDLSEHFLLANDDCYFNRKVTPDFFFTQNGEPIIRLKREKISKYRLKNFMYNRSVQFSNDLINRCFNKKYSFSPHHNIDAYTKTMYKECEKEFSKEFYEMIHSQFRTEGVQRLIIALYMLVKNKCHLRCVKNTKLYRHEDSLYIEIEGEKMLDRIKKTTPFLLCLNDSCRISDSYLNNYKSFLEYLYPEKQIFEKEEEIEGIYSEVINDYKKLEKKYNVFWKIKNKFKYITIYPLRYILNILVDIDKDIDEKEIRICKIIKFKIKRQKFKT